LEHPMSSSGWARRTLTNPVLWCTTAPPIVGTALGLALGPFSPALVLIVAPVVTVVGGIAAYATSCFVNDRMGQPWGFGSFIFALAGFELGAALLFVLGGFEA
jgi:hypothetical protein